MPHPEDDRSALGRAIRASTHVRVFNSGMLDSRPIAESPVLLLDEPTDVREVQDRLRVERVTGAVCMCLGSSTFEFLSDEGVSLAVAALHHGDSLRWHGWQNDAQLADGRRLAESLARHGYTAPLDELRAGEERRARDQQLAARWAADAPAAVRGLLPLMLETSRTGHIDPDLVQRVEERLSVAYSDELVRCRAVLAWFASGTGKCSGYPVHEEIPGQLLERVPMEQVLASLDEQGASDAVWAGALRHLAGWRSRPDGDLGLVPLPVWRRLESIAEGSADADLWQRIAAKRKRVM